MTWPIPFHTAKVQTECSIYAAPAGRSSCFLSFYLTKCDVPDLIIVTYVADQAFSALFFLLFSLLSCFLCSNIRKAARHVGLALTLYMKHDKRPPNKKEEE